MGAASWVEEGFRRLRLVTALARCARALQPKAPELAQKVWEQAVSPALATQLLPGAGEATVVAGADDKDADRAYWARAEARYAAAQPAGTVQQAANLLATALAAAKRPADGPSRPLPPASWPPWADPAPGWVELGAVLARWDRLAPDVRALVDAPEELNKIAAAFEASRQAPGGGADLLFAQAAGTLRTVARLTATAGGAALTAAADEVFQELAAAPDDWPPVFVREVVLGLNIRAVQGPAPADLGALLGLPVDAAARVRVAVGLADAHDQVALARPLSVNAWDRVKRAILALGKSAAQAEVTWEWSPTTRSLVTPVPGQIGTQLERTGVTVVVGGRVVVDRPSAFRVAPPPHPLVAALRDAQAATSDPGLAESCREAERLLPPDGPTGEYWARLTDDDRGVWWRAVLRATLRANTEVAALLPALEGQGFRLVPAASGVPAGGPWYVASDPASGPPTAGPRVAVRFPDGRQVAPAVWVRVGPPARPLVRCLTGCEPLLKRLRDTDPTWEGWARYDEAVWELAYGGRGADGDAGPATLAFEAVYGRARTAPPGLAEPYRELGRRLYRCLRDDLGDPIRPQLDEHTLAPWRLTSPPGDGAEVVWVAGGKQPGEVEILRFPHREQPARLQVKVGPDNDVSAHWLNLPRPQARLLADLQAAVARRVWDPGLKLDAWLAAVKKWLADPAQSGAWFAAAAPDDPWVRTLVQADYCGCFPSLPASGRPVVWSESPGKAGPGVSWEFAPVPLRELVRNPVYATDPARAGGVFSLGRQEYAEPGLLAAAALAETFPDAAPVRSAWRVAVATHLGEPAADPVPLGRELVGWLTGTPAAADEVRRWCAANELELVDQSASYPTPRFSSRDPGEVWVESYGLRAGGVELIPARVVVSAGRAPPHFDRLRQSVERSGSDRVRAALAAWPEAAALHTPRDAAVGFYTDFWGVASSDPPPAPLAPVLAALIDLLRDGYQVVPFRPALLREYPPQWVQYDQRRKVESGDVTRVIRPGLHSADKELLVKAVVEVR